MWSALAAWLSFGALAFDGVSGPRIGVLSSCRIIRPRP
jgi:hypothetical protein